MADNSSSASEPLLISIVGAGCSGSLVAAQLLRQSQPVDINLIDQRMPGRGLAYSTAWDQHLLNVRAARMSAFRSEPSHFLDWLLTHGRPNATGDFFAPRKVFGSYIQDVLQAAVRAAPPQHRLRHHASVAINIVHDGTTNQVVLKNGERIAADRVVLATGNPAPRPLVTNTPNYFNSPWEPGALYGLDSNAVVLLLGSGLTAVDAFLALEAQGHRGAIYCLSRRGLLPRVHTVYRSLPEPFVPAGMAGARDLLRAIRLRIEEAELQGYDWRAVVDSLRPITNDLWQGFAPKEQIRVMRHLKTWWDIHRHRMAPEIGIKLKQALERGQLRIYAGRWQQIAAEEDRLRVDVRLRSQASLTLTVDRLINCTGAEEDYGRVPNPLFQSLRASGRIRRNAIGKGLETDRHGALIDAQGKPSEWLFTLGPPRAGGLFETIAVPELRMQAEALAHYLVATPYEPIETPVEYFMAAGI